VRTVLVSYIDESRSNEEFANKSAILLLDNCIVHVGEHVEKLLAEKEVKMIIFPLHTTHVFQVLDLTLFGVSKRRKHSNLPLDDRNRTAEFIRNCFYCFKQTMIEDDA